MPSKKKIAPDGEQEKLSRSAKKRQSSALQKLGEELTTLSLEERQELNLPEELTEALAEHDRIASHEAKRRQRQYIGKIMRSMDSEGIAKALAIRRNLKAANIARFQELEKWRNKIAKASGQELDECLDQIASRSGSQEKEQLITELRDLAIKVKSEQENSQAFKRIFKILAELFKES